MKKIALSALLTSFALSLSLGAACLSSGMETKAEGEKETVYFDITTEAAIGEYTVLLKTDKTLPSFENHDFTWYVNTKAKTTTALYNSSDPSSISLGWNGEKPADGDYSYHHYHIEAGTAFFETEAAKYVLQSDYNFWWTSSANGTVSSCTWVFQHGGTDLVSDAFGEVDSLTLTGQVGGGVQAWGSRWNIALPYTKGDWAGKNNPWNANLFYADTDGTGYQLIDYTKASGGVYWWLEKFTNATRGTENTYIPFSALGSSDGTLSRYASIYFPKGTLIGGWNGGYGVMIENDAYFEIGEDGSISGIFDTPHDYVLHEAKCGHPGNVEYYSCSRHEGEMFLKKGDAYHPCAESEVKVDVEHNFNFVAEKSSTCDVPGTKAHYECSRCSSLAIKEGETYTLTDEDQLVIPAGHKLVDHDEVPYTCSSDGKRAHKECEVCHKLYLNEDDGLVEANEDDLVLPKRHTVVIIDAKPATCTESGLSQGKKCQICGEIIEEQKTVAALGHRYGGWEFNENDKVISRLCERCYTVESVPVNEDNGFTYKVISDASANGKGSACYVSSKYGTFYVEIPQKEETVSQNGIQIIIASVVCVIAIGISLSATLIVKKKMSHKN